VETGVLIMQRPIFLALIVAIVLLGSFMLTRQHRLILQAAGKKFAATPIQTADVKPPQRQTGPSPELLKLRAEVTSLRCELDQAAPARIAPPSQIADEWAEIHSGVRPSQQPGFLATTELTNAGYATPDAAFQSFLYVLRNQHKEPLTLPKMKEIFDVPDDFDDPNVRYSIHMGEGIGRETGYRIVQQQFLAGNEIKLTIDFEDREGGSFRGDRILVQRNDRWRVKPAGVTRQ
jgi:hypothetical protein